MRALPGILALVAVLSACGAADERVDPDQLALRDLLGVAPPVVAGWDADQRSAARQVLAAGLDAGDPVTLATPLPLGDDAAMVHALAVGDAALESADRDARGLVVASTSTRELAVIDSPTAAALLVAEPADPMISLDVDPRAWTCPQAPCDLTVLAALAVDAAPGARLVRVRPVAQLATIAALTVGADGVPVLLVNPVVTAVGVETAAPPATATTGGAPISAAAPLLPPPLTRGTWSYGSAIDTCVSTVTSQCATCTGGGLCEPVWPSVDGLSACQMLDVDAGRNYGLLCVDLAVSLADVRACVQAREPGCAVDDNAIDTPAELANNAVFLDDPVCRGALDACLTQLYAPSDTGSDGCGSCDGCNCSDKNDNNNGCGGDQNNMNDNCNSCNGGGCSGGNCGGSGGGCGNGGSGGSCSVGSGRADPGVGVALVWVMLPVPVALHARRSRRRRRAADPA